MKSTFPFYEIPFSELIFKKNLGFWEFFFKSLNWKSKDFSEKVLICQYQHKNMHLVLPSKGTSPYQIYFPQNRFSIAWTLDERLPSHLKPFLVLLSEKEEAKKQVSLESLSFSRQKKLESIETTYFYRFFEENGGKHRARLKLRIFVDEQRLLIKPESIKIEAKDGQDNVLFKLSDPEKSCLVSLLVLDNGESKENLFRYVKQGDESFELRYRKNARIDLIQRLPHYLNQEQVERLYDELMTDLALSKKLNNPFDYLCNAID